MGRMKHMKHKFDKILVANRGEIAVRVIQTAKAMGYRTVAVYSEADANTRHMQEADQAVCIGKAPASSSYLVAEKIIDAAKRSGANAIHPGYGFLSENANFARMCADAGITFIGPSAENIELMGSKRLSKVAMLDAGVPCIVGYQGANQDDETLLEEAAKIGYPLMVKASAGGGGRGLRLVEKASDLKAQIKTARSEALNAFGNDELILEKAIIDPRHIEIQVFADTHGNVVNLGERDCSIQRRHQKIIEEAPSPFVDENLRKNMGDTAVNVAKSCNYIGAGTVEFLVDADKKFYFLEMNTRLQVEHPVTELITGLDLVEWQIMIAAGEKLPRTQDKITLTGHAMEVRIYAEDPRHDFMPQTGEILYYSLPDNHGIRIDHGICDGQIIGPHYDPMLAKIIAYGTTREEARRRLACAVEDFVLLGVNNNKRFLANILRTELFADGKATTAFIERHFKDDKSLLKTAPSAKSLGIATLLFYQNSGRITASNSHMVGWRNVIQAPWNYTINCDGMDHKLSLIMDGSCYRITIGDEIIELDLVTLTDKTCLITADGVRERLHYILIADRLHIDGEWGNMTFTNLTHAPANVADGPGTGQVIAPMDGTIIDIMVKPGDPVTKGQSLGVLEAMKMEHQLCTDTTGIVANVAVKKGNQVKSQQFLISVEIETND